VLILLAQVLNTTEEALLSETTKAEDKAEKLAVQEDLVVYIPDAVALTGLDADDRRTVIRLLNALRSGDAEVRWHLIRQLKIIEHALTARRQMPPEDLDAAQ
jgi:hypothetical protein